MQNKPQSATKLPLIQAIENLQTLRGLTDRAFMKEVGMDPSLLSKFKKGHRPPGGKFLRKLSQAFPELRLAIFQHMNSED